MELLADYLFSNEYVNYLITYTFDFQHEELLSYYISFLRYFFLLLSRFQKVFMDCLITVLFALCRAVSGKLNKHTISLLLKTENVSIL